MSVTNDTNATAKGRAPWMPFWGTDFMASTLGWSASELRRVGIPVTTYSPGGRKKNQDKIARANAVAPVFESGMVWAPQTKWAEELIEECAAFPKGDNDDLVDSTVQAISRFRAGNFVALDDDEADDPVTQLEFEYY